MHLQVGEDPFTQLKKEKKDRVKKNQKQQLENLKVTAKGGGQLPASLRLAAQLPEHGRGPPEKKRIKDDVSASLGLSLRWPLDWQQACQLNICDDGACLLMMHGELV